MSDTLSKSKINKLQAAECQLDTSIRLFFENIDHLSSYALAAASREVTDQLCSKEEGLYIRELTRVGDAQKVRLNFFEEMKILTKPEHFKDALKLMNKTKNFLKHADTDENEIDKFTTDELASTIFFAINNYSLIAQAITPAMQVFLVWHAAANPNLLKQQKAKNEFMGMVESMRRQFTDLYSGETFYAIYKGITLNPKYKIDLQKKYDFFKSKKPIAS